MIEQAKWDYINELDEQLLKGDVILSEWTSLLVRDAETAFCCGANLSSILACQAAIESHLRFDYFNSIEAKGWGFFLLINNSSLSDNLKRELHEVRKYRNKWVHVSDPSDDTDLLKRPEYYEEELENFAKKAVAVMLKTLYASQGI